MNCLRIITTNAPGVGDHHGKLISKAALYQLCSCNRNGLLSLIMLNYDLYVHNVIHNAKLWPFVIHNCFKRSQFLYYERHCEWQKGSQYCEWHRTSLFISQTAYLFFIVLFWKDIQGKIKLFKRNSSNQYSDIMQAVPSDTTI